MILGLSLYFLIQSIIHIPVTLSVANHNSVRVRRPRRHRETNSEMPTMSKTDQRVCTPEFNLCLSSIGKQCVVHFVLAGSQDQIMAIEVVN